MRFKPLQPITRRQPIIGHSIAMTSNCDDDFTEHSCVGLGLEFSMVTTATSSFGTIFLWQLTN
ncbi:hypothetical protein CIPAW_13G105100 [Carya illinoinensis]|uniref:Uncharacterized protein n=1 Tax=Carya illinoinensis TaxID=32201 RepID=A0A8T1NIE4_CARIL|nr:hypothetical protein CIPAW_13G105100 [Carya illinoinensis]